MAMNLLSERQNHVIIVPSMKSKGGAIVGRPSKYANMSKEEIIADMRMKSREKDASKWKKTVTLTKAEGEILETEILPKHECANVSQLVKKIVHGELIVSPAEPSESSS